MAEGPQAEAHTVALQEQVLQFEEQFKQDPKAAARPLAELYLEGGRPQDALRALDAADTADVEVQILRAQAEFDLFNTTDSISILRVTSETSHLSQNARAQLLLGELAVHEGRNDEAKRHLHRVLELSPAHGRAARLLAQLGEDVTIPNAPEITAPVVTSRSASSAEPEGAAQFLKHIGIGVLVFSLITGGYVWWARRAHAAEELVREALSLADKADIGSLREADRMYSEALAIQGSNDHALAGRAEINAVLWVVYGIAESETPALEYVATARKNGIERAERYAAEALIAMKQARLDDAGSIISGVLARGGLSDHLLWVHGLVQMAQGKVALARANFLRAHQTRSSAAHYAASLGDANDFLGEDRSAGGFWSTSYKNNSSFAPAVVRNVLVRSRRGEAREGLLRELARLEGQPPELLGPNIQAELHMARAEVLYRDGQLKEALVAAEKSLSVNAKSPQGLRIAGKILLALGQVDKAVKSLEQAAFEAHFAEGFLYQLVEAQARSGKLADAIRVLQDQKQRLEGEPQYYVALGNAFRDSGDSVNAHASYDKALDLYEDYSDALLARGTAYWRQKDYAKATAQFEKAIQGRPNFPEVYSAVGLMWIEQGATAEGTKQLENAETQFLALGADRMRMTRFYREAADALAPRSGTTAKTWQQKLERFATGHVGPVAAKGK